MAQTNKLTLETEDDVQRFADTLDTLAPTPRRQRTVIGVARKWLYVCWKEKLPKGIVKINDALLAVGYGMNPPSLAHNIASDATLFNYPTITARAKDNYIVVIGSMKKGLNPIDKIVMNLRKDTKFYLLPSELPAMYLKRLDRLTQLLSNRLGKAIKASKVGDQIRFQVSSS